MIDLPIHHIDVFYTLCYYLNKLAVHQTAFMEGSMQIGRHLVLESQAPLTRELFCSTHPRGSIAIDGYLPEGPWLDSVRLYGNFNHHEGVDRLATRCTAAQVVMALRLGRMSAFEQSGMPLHVWYNDCDPDVIASLWVLLNPARARPVVNPLFNKLLHLLDMLDTTAATYPFPYDLDLRTYHWVFEPYFRAVMQGAVDRKQAKVFEQIIQDCFLRINAYLVGNAGQVEVITSYESILMKSHWGMFRPHGNLSRMGIVAAGYYAFVLVRERDDGRYTYTVQRTSDGVVFPLSKIFAALNKAEGGVEQWGGGDTVGGSPRTAGSRLSPDEVATVIEAVLASSS